MLEGDSGSDVLLVTSTTELIQSEPARTPNFTLEGNTIHITQLQKTITPLQIKHSHILEEVTEDVEAKAEAALEAAVAAQVEEVVDATIKVEAAVSEAAVSEAEEAVGEEVSVEEEALVKAGSWTL